jgi:hypothetical protein
MRLTMPAPWLKPAAVGADVPAGDQGMTRRPNPDERCGHEAGCEARAIHVVDDTALCARHGVEALETRVLRVRQDLIALGVQARVGEGHLIARGRNLSRDEARQLLAKLHDLLADYPEPVEALLRVS